MSISEQVKELRSFSEACKVMERHHIAKSLEEAADTIESLSAKVEDMERPVADCGGGWILCEDKLPEENKEVICCFESGVVEALVLYNCKFHGKVYAYEKSDIIAWQPLPEPYHES